MLAGKVILKMEKINVQVTLKDPSFETITEILRSHVSFTSLNFLCSKVVFHYIRLNLSRVKFHNTFSIIEHQIPIIRQVFCCNSYSPFSTSRELLS